MNGQDKYKIKWSTRFKKDYKLAIKRGYNIDLLDNVIRLSGGRYTGSDAFQNGYPQRHVQKMST